MKKTHKGFTLIEMLLSVLLISTLALISFPIYQSFQNKNDMDIATTSIVQSLRRAQLLAQNMDGDSTWGVKIQSGSIVIFKGVNYAVRDVNYDEVFDVPASITFSGIGEVVFSKLAGAPSATGNITVASSITSNETRTISINSKGRVDF